MNTESFLFSLSYYVYFNQYEIVDQFFEILNSYDECKETYEKHKEDTCFYMEPEAKYCCLVIFSVLSCMEIKEIRDKVVSILSMYEVSGLQKHAFNYIIHGCDEAIEKKISEDFASFQITYSNKNVEWIPCDWMENAFQDVLRSFGVLAEADMEDVWNKHKQELIRCVDFISEDKQSYYLCMYIYAFYFIDLMKEIRLDIHTSLDTKKQESVHNQIMALKGWMRDCEEKINLIDHEIQHQKRANIENVRTYENKISKEYRESISSFKKDIKQLDKEISILERENKEISKLKEALYFIDHEMEVEYKNLDCSSLKKKSIAFIGTNESLIQYLKEEMPSILFVSSNASIPYKKIEKVKHVFFYPYQLNADVYKSILDCIILKDIPFDFIVTKRKENILLEMLNKL